MSEAMTINDIINQLGSLRASSAEFAKSDTENEIWQADVAACETAIRILAALSGAGCTDLETTLDFLQDYNSLAKQYQTNATGDTITINCIACGSPIDMQLNGRGTAYVTLRDAGGGALKPAFRSTPYYIND